MFNDSFFMPLFFFISAYFVPTSYDRKGKHEFLKDKFNRLGIPFLVVTLVLHPLMWTTLLKVFSPPGMFPGHVAYRPIAGPTWFIGWLLILNFAYTLVDCSILTLPPRVTPRPGFTCYFCLAGLCAGFLQGLLMIAVPGVFIFMPNECGSLPFDIMFFVAGTVAQRCDWLGTPIPTDQRRKAAIWTTVIAFFLISLPPVIFLVSVSTTATTTASPTATLKDMAVFKEAEPQDGEIAHGVLLVAFMSLLGCVCMVISFAVVALSQHFLNFKNAWTTFFSDAAYTAYLIHSFVLILFTWLYIRLVETAWGVEIRFPANSTTSNTDLGGDGLIWFGWLGTNLLTQLVVWPLAWGLRRLPGLNKIL